MVALFAATDPAGCEEAWGRFVQAHSALMLRVSRSLGGGYDGAMDRYAFTLEQLRQNDFRRLRAYLPDEGAPFEPWLLVVTRRLCLDAYRQRYGRARNSSDSSSDTLVERKTRRTLADLLATEIELSSLPDSSRLSPDSELILNERSRALEFGLNRLEPRDRLLLKLRFEDELSAREIADLMRFPTLFHVYRRLKAVLTDLRELLGQSGIEEADA